MAEFRGKRTAVRAAFFKLPEQIGVPMQPMNQTELFARGIFIEQMTPRTDLERLIRALWPVQTIHPLVRIGGPNDGGYIVPEDFSDIAACYSPGVENCADFEVALLERYGINAHQADLSVEGPPPGFAPLSFTRKFLGPRTNNEHMTLAAWLAATGDNLHDRDLLLQMDIEGGEYLTLLATDEVVLRRFRIAVIEFHDTHTWGCRQVFRMVYALFEKLLANFYVVHNHPNNCSALIDLGGVHVPPVFELTLLRRDRAEPVSYRTDFPHPLDRPNLPGRPDLHLPPAWRCQA